MSVLTLVLAITGTICVGLAAFSVQSPPRLSWGWLGVLLWALAFLIPMLR